MSQAPGSSNRHTPRRQPRADAVSRGSGMSKSLRILHLEDIPADVERVNAELTRAGMKVVSEPVSSKGDFTSALREFKPDVVLCDHSHAAYEARGALAILQAHRPFAPLILVSSVIDEQAAVTSVRAGAEDIVLKRNLGPAEQRHRGSARYPSPAAETGAPPIGSPAACHRRPHHARDRSAPEAQRQDGGVSSGRGDEASGDA